MGIRLLTKSREDTVETVSLLDTSIDEKRSNIDAFVQDRSDLSNLVLVEPPSSRPWEGPAYFTIRALDDYELAFAARLSGVEVSNLAPDIQEEILFPYLWWMFRLGCVNWRGIYREAKGDEKDPQEIEYKANRVGPRFSADDEVMKFIPSEVIVDIGSVVLNISVLTESEKKASGSQPPTQENSTISDKSAVPTEAVG